MDAQTSPAALSQLIGSHDMGTVFKIENGIAAVADPWSSDAPHAPEAHASDPHHLDGMEGWTALEGASGQHGYDGPLMHDSEFVGAVLAGRILELGDGYVTCALVSVIDDETDEIELSWIVATHDLHTR